MSTPREATTPVAPAGAPARPLRVLMVLESNFAPHGGGGAESQVRTLARHLLALGHDVTVITPMFPWGPQVAAEQSHGLPVRRIAYPKRPVIGGMVVAAKLAATLWQRRHQDDAWHVHIGHNLGAVTCLVGAVLGKPVVVKISGWWELEQGLLASRSPLGRLGRSLLRRAGTVQAISTRIAHELAERGFPTERILVLPNAVDLSRFRAGTAARVPGQPFVAVFVGRLVAEKGLLTLLEAWAQAFAGRTDVRLRLVGGGPLEAELRALADQLGIAGQVELLGHRDRVEDVLAEAHVGVLPSRIEGLSNTLLEFMATGLPTLASRVSGSEDFVIPGQNGWLFPVGDVAALAAALREAEALPAARLVELGRAARAEVETRASLATVVGQLLSLYRGAHPRELQGGH